MATWFLTRATATLTSSSRIIRTLGTSCNFFGKWTYETNNCGSLRLEHVGKRVCLTGWIQNSRMDQKFVVLRDGLGIVQVVLPDNGNPVEEDIERYKALPLESAVCIEGTVTKRPDGQVNRKMATGDVEVVIDKINMMSKARASLPFYVKPGNEALEELRMRHRYLDLRHLWLQSNLRLRSEVTNKMRSFLLSQDLVEVETPTLFKRTPGGAREFIVPTKQKDKFYSLVQSPQQFKQLLMVGGFNKYFQIARCYRDESGMSDRQPEFTQVDIEMAFTDAERIRGLCEALIKSSWPSSVPSLSDTDQFPKLTYAECMNNYGSDKPDLRITNSIVDLADFLKTCKSDFATSQLAEEKYVKALVFRKGDLPGGGLTKNQLQFLNTIAKEKVESKGWNAMTSYFTFDGVEIKGSLVRKLTGGDQKSMEKLKSSLSLEEGDIGVMTVSEQKTAALESLGAVRQHMIKCHMNLDPHNFKFLWVVDFPLFFPDGDKLESAHHPFTRPHEDDAHLLHDQPLKIRGQNFDLVLNGQEVGGGSMRIHDHEMQRYILEELLQEDTSLLEHLLEALSCGCPPHGGIALGLDRIIAILCKSRNIRDVIAFPKTSEGSDLMSNAPSNISDADKYFYHLK